MKQITLEVPEDIDEKIAKLLFELGLANHHINEQPLPSFS
jgi:hypothetical protein